MTTTKLTMLTVDDEPDMLDFLERTFRQRFTVTRAGDPEQALALLRERQFDVLITDQMMPKGTGLGLLERIVESHPKMIKVLLSGYTEGFDAARAVAEAGAAAVLVKPVDPEDLRTLVSEFLSRREA